MQINHVEFTTLIRIQIFTNSIACVVFAQATVDYNRYDQPQSLRPKRTSSPKRQT